MGDDADKFVWSVKNGEAAAVQEFVDKGRDVNAQINGRYPLHYAADYGQVEVIEYLLTKGAKINAPDKFEITPLLSAVFEGHTECVRVLLKKGADKSGKSPDGASYVDCAEKQEIKDLLK
ncbi:myotrophin-like [Littorina saxatilis]|uniref:Myotrophin n=1 Tax=Littorina saxatilis TaxID=31220 RepID=A0AAN9G9N1_9CAEN